MIYLTHQELAQVYAGQEVRGISAPGNIGFGDAPIKSLQYKDKNGKVTTWSDYNYKMVLRFKASLVIIL